MGTFSRLRYVMAANFNALLEKAENPEKLLRALIREMEDAGDDAREASAELLAEQQHLERVERRLGEEINEWSDRAERAVASGRDDLARTALKARTDCQARREAAIAEREDLAARITQLETDMGTLKAKLADARARLKAMQVRPPHVESPVGTPPKQLSRNERRVRQALGRFDRLQNQVDRLEARVRSYELGESAVPAWQDRDAPADPAVEAELEALKEKLRPAKAPAAPVTKAETAAAGEEASQ